MVYSYLVQSDYSITFLIHEGIKIKLSLFSGCVRDGPSTDKLGRSVLPKNRNGIGVCVCEVLLRCYYSITAKCF